MAFTYKLEFEDGTPADPPTFRTAVPTWNAGDMIPFGDGRTLEVVAERWTGEDPTLIVRSTNAESAA
jgi:hypothetical protein